MINVSIEPTEFVAGQDARMRVLFANEGAGTCTNVVFKLGLPPELLLVRGGNLAEIPAIRAGEVRSRDVVIRAATPGTCTVGSPNFSYLDEYGRSVRKSDFKAAVSVLSAAPASGAGRALDVRCDGGRLAPGEWSLLRVLVSNTGPASLRALTVTVRGRVAVDPPHSAGLARLAAGEAHRLDFRVFPEAAGRLPAVLHVSYVDELGLTQVRDLELPEVAGTRPGMPGRPEAATGRPDLNTILFVAANPRALEHLQSDKEMERVGNELRLGGYRDRYDLKYCPAAQIEDIGRALITYQPRIVHFSGHGVLDGYLAVEDEIRRCRLVTPEGLAALLENHRAAVRCVILNACHSLRPAEAIAKHIAHVVAMRSAIVDQTAITFSVGFYQGVAGGLPMVEAFKQGRALLMAKDRGMMSHEIPVLYEAGALYS